LNPEVIRSEELAVVQGWQDTRATLEEWRRHPLRPLARWTAGALAVSAALLTATWLVAIVSPPDPSGAIFPGVYGEAGWRDYRYVLIRNGLVLTLHALACVAGFMAGSALPVVAEGYMGWKRWVHDKAGPLAIAFVVCATLFSLATQAFVLGGDMATLAKELELSPAVLLACLLPHALPELTALFLPLAAWTLASRRGAWKELLAATFATTAVAIPVLLASGAIEVWVTPDVIRAAAHYTF
jgi:hypothetical protein